MICLLVVASGCIGVAVRGQASPPPRPPALPAHAGTVDLGEFDVVSRAGALWVEFEALYVNDSGWMLGEVVIWCRATDTEGYQLGAHRWLLDSQEVGPIEPEFRIRVPVSFRVLDRSEVERLECTITDAR